MISFASLFLGLVFGIVNVELVVSREVTRVELFLDGNCVAEIREPWKTPLDLGRPPAPHELTAVAFDESGVEIGRRSQWINRPRALAEASFVLDAGKGGTGRMARLTWFCLTGEKPKSIAVTFDGKLLPVTDPARIEIPPHVPEQVHFLRAELVFEGNVTAVTDAAFGGIRNEGTLTGLTALFVVLEGGKPLPPPPGMEGWFVSRAGPLAVAAIDEGPVEVVFVCEGSAGKELRRMSRDFELLLARNGYALRETALRGKAFQTGREPDFRFLWPIVQSRTQSTTIVNTFPVSGHFSAVDGGQPILAYLGRVQWPAFFPKNQRIADAVAVAALSASEQERRRAVVLIQGPNAEDASLLSAEEAGSFLSQLRVPLVVWSLAERRAPEASRWKNVVRLTSWKELRVALSDLLNSLGQQRIVWVEGTHLPQSITLGPAAQGIQLAR